MYRMYLTQTQLLSKHIIKKRKNANPYLLILQHHVLHKNLFFLYESFQILFYFIVIKKKLLYDGNT